MQIFLIGIGPTRTLEIEEEGTLLSLLNVVARKLELPLCSFRLQTYNKYCLPNGSMAFIGNLSINDNINKLNCVYSITNCSNIHFHWSFQYLRNHCKNK